jgi:hypothetical protein
MKNAKSFSRMKRSRRKRRNSSRTRQWQLTMARMQAQRKEWRERKCSSCPCSSRKSSKMIGNRQKQLRMSSWRLHKKATPPLSCQSM